MVLLAVQLKEGINIVEDDVESIEVGDDKLVRVMLAGRVSHHVMRQWAYAVARTRTNAHFVNSCLQRVLEADLALYSGGRDANSEKIGCENVGVKVGKYGRIVVSRACDAMDALASDAVLKVALPTPCR